MIYKPNFFVIGAPKSGTTSLHYYLKQHPDVFLPEKKELHFFSREFLNQHQNGPGDKFVLKNLPETMDGYLSNYKAAQDSYKVIGDISPSYLYYYKSADKIFEFNKIAKIIIMLRNPVEKTYSQYMHQVSLGKEENNFPDALNMEEEREDMGWSDFWLYRKSTTYCKEVEYYLKRFGNDNVHIVLFENFVSNRETEMKKICNFLEIDENFIFELEKIHNQSGAPKSKIISKLFLQSNVFTNFLRKVAPRSLGSRAINLIKSINRGEKQQLRDSEKEFLYEYFKEDVICLEKLLNIKTGWLKGEG